MISGSSLCTKGELDLYSIPPTLTTMNKAFINEFQPVVNPNGNTAPIEFIIPRQSERWIDLMDIDLQLDIKLVKLDNTNVANESDISIVENPLHSLFNHVDIYINSKLISGNDKYAYRAFFETLCGSSETEQNMFEETQLWSKPVSGETRYFATYAAAGAANSGKKRNRLLTDGKIVELQGKLHTDLTRQNKYLPNMCELKIRLVRSPPAFYMKGDDGGEAKIEITKAVLKIRSVILEPDVWVSLNSSLRTKPMNIPIKKVDISVFTVMDGLQSKIESNLIHGQIPKRIIIGQVKNAIMNGDPIFSPFSFDHFNIKKLKVTVNGLSIDANPLYMDFSNDVNKFCESYRSFWKTLGIEHGKDLYVYSKQIYKEHHTLWGFDFTPDLGCEEGHLHPIQTGNIEFDMAWSTPLLAPINVIVYAEYDDLIMIDGLRNAITS